MNPNIVFETSGGEIELDKKSKELKPIGTFLKEENLGRHHRRKDGEERGITCW